MSKNDTVSMRPRIYFIMEQEGKSDDSSVKLLTFPTYKLAEAYFKANIKVEGDISPEEMISYVDIDIDGCDWIDYTENDTNPVF